MKKYYMKETGNEVKFGDTIELDFVKKRGNKVIKEHLECPFHPSLIPLLKKRGLIIEKEVREEKDEDKLVHDFLQLLLATLENLVKCNTILEDRVTALEDEVSKLMKNGKARK